MCLGILLILNELGRIELGSNEYVNPFFLLIASYTGWQFLYEIATCINEIPYKKIKKVVLLMGQNTMAIVIFHFICFKLINYIIVICNNMPYFFIAAFPVLYSNGIWWIIYTMVGIAIPVLLSEVWKNGKKKWICRGMKA